MDKKPARDEDKPQHERFIEKARELGADESEDALDRVFKRIVPPKEARPSGKSPQSVESD